MAPKSIAKSGTKMVKAGAKANDEAKKCVTIVIAGSSKKIQTVTLEFVGGAPKFPAISEGMSKKEKLAASRLRAALVTKWGKMSKAERLEAVKDVPMTTVREPTSRVAARASVPTPIATTTAVGRRRPPVRARAPTRKLSKKERIAQAVRDASESMMLEKSRKQAALGKRKAEHMAVPTAARRTVRVVRPKRRVVSLSDETGSVTSNESFHTCQSPPKAVDHAKSVEDIDFGPPPAKRRCIRPSSLDVDRSDDVSLLGLEDVSIKEEPSWRQKVLASIISGGLAAFTLSSTTA